MGCPLHIWVPLMGAAAPLARIAHLRLRAFLDGRNAAEEAPRELKRWAPVGQSATRDTSEPTN